MRNDSLDRLVIFWIMPPLGFLMTVLQVPTLRYLISNYVVMGVLITSIIIRIHIRSLTRRAILLIVLALILMVAFLCIEWLHFVAGRQTIDGLTDVRMIIYSSFYGSIIIFVLYAIYLICLSDGQRRSHLDFVIRLLSCFHLFFLGLWLLLYLGLIDPIPRTELLHSNSVSYSALFTLCVMLCYREIVTLRTTTYGLFFAVNGLVIFLNHTRGAIIGLIFIGGYYFINNARNAKRALLMCLLLGALACIVALIGLTNDDVLGQVLGRDVGSLGTVLNEISDAFARGELTVVADPRTVSDESSLSAFSRIGSNYYSLLSFLDNPFLGIGQAESYSIDILGSGVHSLHFLMANATGVLGLALFSGILATLFSAQHEAAISGRFIILFFIFFGYMLLFVNSLPVYFSLIVTILATQRNQRIGIKQPNWEVGLDKRRCGQFDTNTLDAARQS